VSGTGLAKYSVHEPDLDLPEAFGVCDRHARVGCSPRRAGRSLALA
jgi:hypothetical protein